MTEDEMVGWHHRLNGHEFEQTPGDGDGQGTLVCCSPWGRKELGITEQLNNNSKEPCRIYCVQVPVAADRMRAWETGPQARSESLPAFINKVLLTHRNDPH